MSLLPKVGGEQRKSWCALVIVIAVCSLTLSVATRYSSPPNPSPSTVRAVHRQIAMETTRQRLTKNAANWMPPVVCAAVLEAPRSYPRVAPAEPPIPSLLVEANVYNRPPPSSVVL